MSVLRRYRRRIDRAKGEAAADYARYARDPVGYARDVLRVDWWRVQQEIARSLLDPPYKTLVLASHGVGKTYLSGGLVNWWYDSHPVDSAVLSTAPTDREVCDLLWREVRLQRSPRGGFRGPAAPELSDGENHYAKGISPGRAESFQGRHPRHLLIILEEAVGVRPFVWRTIKTMFAPTGDHACLAIANPTDTTSEMYAEAMAGGWNVIQMSALDHPNIAAELAGEPPPFPAAVRLAQVNEQLRDWCTPVAAKDATATDVEWPPGAGVWLRPGPEAEARVFGRWPSSATYGVWSDSLWAACEAARLDLPRVGLQFGCDVARHGDDWTAIHGRVGPCSILHERGNGWDTVRTATRLIELCREHAPAYHAEPNAVPIVIDDTGVGGGVVDIVRANGFNAVPVNAAEAAWQSERYPDARSELWFAAAEQARDGRLDVSRLSAEDRRRLRVQVLAPEWRPDSRARRRVEPKAETKRRTTGRSPDDADAMNLCYYGVGPGVMEMAPRVERPAVRVPRRVRPMFGR